MLEDERGGTHFDRGVCRYREGVIDEVVHIDHPGDRHSLITRIVWTSITGNNLDQVHQVGDRLRRTVIINIGRDDATVVIRRIFAAPGKGTVDEVVGVDNPVGNLIRDSIKVDITPVIRRRANTDQSGKEIYGRLWFDTFALESGQTVIVR